jgi:hypothetical protein
MYCFLKELIMKIPMCNGENCAMNPYGRFIAFDVTLGGKLMSTFLLIGKSVQRKDCSWTDYVIGALDVKITVKINIS